MEAAESPPGPASCPQLDWADEDQHPLPLNKGSLQTSPEVRQASWVPLDLGDVQNVDTRGLGFSLRFPSPWLSFQKSAAALLLWPAAEETWGPPGELLVLLSRPRPLLRMALMTRHLAGWWASILGGGGRTTSGAAMAPWRLGLSTQPQSPPLTHVRLMWR